MGNRLSKEQEQCFWLIQQLFKAAGCLPDKGSLHLEYGEKQGRAALIVRKSLDKKRKGLMSSAAASNTARLVRSAGLCVCWLEAWLGGRARICSQHIGARFFC